MKERLKDAVKKDRLSYLSPARQESSGLIHRIKIPWLLILWIHYIFVDEFSAFDSLDKGALGGISVFI